VTFLWQPMLPPVAIVLSCAVAGLVAMVAAGRVMRARPITALSTLGARLLVIAALAVLLMNPVRQKQVTIEQPGPRAMLLIDTSASMQVRDERGQSRYGAAVERWLNPKTLADLEAMFDAPPVIAGFDGEVRTVSADALKGEPARRATGEQSNVIEAVRASVDALGDAAPGSVIILVSDGHDRTQSAPDAAIRAARERGVRLVAAAMGGPAGATDYAITAHAEPPRLHVGQRGEVVARMLAPPDAGTVEVTLHDLQDRAASPMQRSVTIDATGRGEVRFPVAPSAVGAAQWRAELQPGPDEIALSNNTAAVTMAVTREPVRVLLLEGAPSFTTRDVARAVRRDDRLALTQLVQVGPDLLQTSAETDAVSLDAPPKSLPAWSAFDVVLLGRRVDRMLDASAGAALVRWVSQRGGTVIFLRGRAWPGDHPLAESLAALSPVNWSDREQRQAAGAIVEGDDVLAWIDPGTFTDGGWLDAWTAPKPGAAVHLATSGRPAKPWLTSMRIGSGRVAAILADGWNVEAPTAHDQLWRGLIGWLTQRSELVGSNESLRVEPAHVARGEAAWATLVRRFEAATDRPVEATWRRLDATGDVEAQGTAMLEPVIGSATRWSGRVPTNEPGVYEIAAPLEAEDASAPRLEARWSVFESSDERLLSDARPALLRDLAHGAGGLFVDATTAPEDALAEIASWPRGDGEDRTLVEQSEPVWRHWTVLVALAAAMAGEYVWRRREGLR